MYDSPDQDSPPVLPELLSDLTTRPALPRRLSPARDVSHWLSASTTPKAGSPPSPPAEPPASLPRGTQHALPDTNEASGSTPAPVESDEVGNAALRAQIAELEDIIRTSGGDPGPSPGSLGLFGVGGAQAAPPAPPARTGLSLEQILNDKMVSGTLAPYEGMLKKEKEKAQKKRKQAKMKAVEDGGAIPPPRPAPPAETAEETAGWRRKLRRGERTLEPPIDDILAESSKARLAIFRTPSCAALQLRTKRLILRQVEVGDTTAIRKIKTEPLVNCTQLYGEPGPLDIRPVFLSRYIRSSVPWFHQDNKDCRDSYIFAITLKDPSSIKLNPAGKVRVTNRITNAEGYIGNIGISLRQFDKPILYPVSGIPHTQPVFAEHALAKFEGSMFYELHPQVQGHGLASEAFAEMLRFAIEEVGCNTVYADPTRGNDASVRICEKNGLRFVRESADNAARKPQLFHAITRQEWYIRNRAGVVVDSYNGKPVCRWCMDPRAPPPAFQCEHCNWASYCSRECQYADWVMAGGHQAQCS